MDDLTDFQLGKLTHAFGLDYHLQPWRNYYHCNGINNEWEDMCTKGYADKSIMGHRKVIYYGTLKGLRKVFRKNVTEKYFHKRCPMGMHDTKCEGEI